MALVVRRFDVYLVALDPTVGSEIRKTRPCVVVSPNSMSRYIDTLIIAPMTTRGHDYPWRVPCRFQGRDGEIVVDQVRAVDKSRLVKQLGRIDSEVRKALLHALAEMFAE